MKLRIHLFAGLAETIGTRMLTVELPRPDMTVDQIKRHVAGLYPAAAEGISPAFVAVNQAYAAGDAVIREQDEIAFIPPVSGG